MNAIGGYFELEFCEIGEYYPNAIALNSARNALEYILKARKYRKIYIPYYTCDVILEPLKKLKIDYDFYYIKENLEPDFDYSKLRSNEVFLYTNYFGIKDKFVCALRVLVKNLIIDNAQSFFSPPIDKTDTFYSPRKFFGVSDGAFLFCDSKLNDNFEQDLSFNRMSHLLIRADNNAEAGYFDFSKNDSSLNDESIKYMSNLTKKILNSIDYQSVKKSRIKNFEYLHSFLKDYNLLKIEISKKQVPMVYPFWTKDISLKKKLLEQKIYCATYWPNVVLWCHEDSIEVQLSKELIHLPIDQRYGIKEMERIIKIIGDV